MNQTTLSVTKRLSFEYTIVLLLSALILLLHFFFHSEQILSHDYSIFYLDEEFSVGSVFTTCVAFLTFVYGIKITFNSTTIKRKLGYIAASSLFIYYAFEESFSFRDSLNNFLKEHVDFISEIAKFSWVFSLGIFVLIFFVILLTLGLKEKRRVVRYSIFMGLLSFILVVLLELIGVRLYGISDWYIVVVGFEEFMEMIGLAFFLNAFTFKLKEPTLL